MKHAVALLAVLGVAFALNGALVTSFADAHWNCVDAACSSRVSAGTFQSNYQCAEFVSRSLAAAGVFPGLTASSSQSAFLNYKYSNGKTYDLLWVSSVQGLPLGLEDLLQVLGWKSVGTSCSAVQAGYVGICTGSDGPHSHTWVGVGANLADAHNSARFHVPCTFFPNNVIYAPPGGVSPPAPAPEPSGCVAEYTTTTEVNLRASASLSGAIVLVLPNGATVYDMSGSTTASGGYNWRHISYNGQLGYAADNYLTKVKDCTAPQTYCVTASPNLRLRASPSTSAATVTSIPTGGAVTSLSTTLTSANGYQWRHVSYGSVTGYVANEYIKTCTPLGAYQNVNFTNVDPGDCTNPVGTSSTIFATLFLVFFAVVLLF